MLQDLVKKGSTDRSVKVRIIDSADGTPEEGVVSGVTVGIALWYRREGGAKVAISDTNLAALTTPHTDGGLKHIDDGDYRLDLPDAAFAAGANYVDFGGTVTGMMVIGGRVRLTDIDLEDATAMGLSRLDAAITTRMATFTLPANFALLGINSSGHITRVSLVDLLTAIDTDGITAAALSAAAVAKIEAALLNEGDGQALIDAIVQAIDAADIDTDILPALIRDAILNRVLAGNHDTAGTVGKLIQDIIADTGTDIPNSIAALNDLDAAGVRAAVGLGAANLDAQLGDIPTVAEFNARTLLASAYATQAKLLAYIQLLARKDVAIGGDKAAELDEINADEGSGAGAYSQASDSQEAIRDASGGGGGGGARQVNVSKRVVHVKGGTS